MVYDDSSIITSGIGLLLGQIWYVMGFYYLHPISIFSVH